MESKKLKLYEGALCVNGKENSIYVNMDNQTQLTVSNECINIIEHMLKNKISLIDMLEYFEEEEDRAYFEKLCKTLMGMGVLVEEERKYYYKGSDMVIYINITNQCNLRCLHCCFRAGEQQGREDFSKEELLRLMDEMIVLNPKCIILSGGEPLFRDDFYEVVSYLRKEYKKALYLMTNGTLIREKNIDFLCENFDGFDISLDGYDENTVSQIRGKGVYEKVIRGITLIKERAPEKEISLSMVETSITEGKSEEFYKLCEKLKVQSAVRELSLLGRARDNEKEMMIQNKSILKWEEVWKTEDMGEAKRKIKLSTGSLLSACPGGFTKFKINYNGDIFPCPVLEQKEFVFGNFHQIINLKEFLEKRKFDTSEGYKNYSKYLPKNFEGCKDCNKKIYCLPCPMIMITEGKLSYKNPHCNFNREAFDCIFEE
ncbi:MAG: radical SAM protein [Lachnospiraceae bacterium]|nr:radical SAM protein [Lachnospiraceae bacterium]